MQMSHIGTTSLLPKKSSPGPCHQRPCLAGNVALRPDAMLLIGSTLKVRLIGKPIVDGSNEFCPAVFVHAACAHSPRHRGDATGPNEPGAGARVGLARRDKVPW